MKIFKKIQYEDGGPNDRGVVIDYVFATDSDTNDTLRVKFGITHGGIYFMEIDTETYYKNYLAAKREYELFHEDQFIKLIAQNDFKMSDTN